VRSRLAAVGQQGCIASPQPSHRPAVHAPSPAPQDIPAPRHIPRRQQPPALHASPAQQGWPCPPQATHTLEALQAALALQDRPPQQGSPMSPQATHLASPAIIMGGGAQTVSGAAQLSLGRTPAQQAFPSDPQFAHRPPGPQAPPGVAHGSPAATQRLFEQQPPARHCWPGQQAMPVAPQGVHTPSGGIMVASQALPVSQYPPAQQICPGPPQDWQTPTPAPVHTVFEAVHVRAAQHSCGMAPCCPPHPPHEPPRQVASGRHAVPAATHRPAMQQPLSRQRLPLQHT
jgi:hypothetical protein